MPAARSTPRLRIRWDGRLVPGVFEVDGVGRAVAVVDWRTGGAPNSGAVAPGLSSYAPVRLRRCLAADGAFCDWMQQVNAWQATGGQSGESDAQFRKEVTIEWLDPVGGVAAAVQLHRAWPARLDVEGLNAGSAHRAVEVLELHHEGWEMTVNARPPVAPATEPSTGPLSVAEVVFTVLFLLGVAQIIVGLITFVDLGPRRGLPGVVMLGFGGLTALGAAVAFGWATRLSRTRRTASAPAPEVVTTPAADAVEPVLTAGGPDHLDST